MAKKKNKNVPPMTQAIEEPVQSPQQTPNTGYPNSAYPNSGYPNSGYPNSAYPGSGYFVQEKKKSLAVPIAIAAGVVVIVAVMAVLFLMRNNNQMGMMPPKPSVRYSCPKRLCRSAASSRRPCSRAPAAASAWHWEAAS